ncbi:DNA polymerase III subunit delta [candidate division GN15 bacterium]|nr:DNA polymerase III subunit delta [candidate division GN15 bacterium]
MRPRDLSAELNKGKFRPVYYFFGSEDFRIIEAEQFVARQFLPDKQMTTNYRRLDGRKVSCADLLAELSVYPMLGEKQVIAVSDFQSFKPTEVDRVLKLLDPPDPNRLIILSSPSSKAPRKKSAFLSKMQKVAEVVEFGKLGRDDTIRTISGKLSKAGLSIEPDALHLLIDLIAGNRGALEVEVAKLVDFKQAGAKIGIEDVRAVAAGYQVYNIFELAEDIVRGDKAKVLKSIERLIADGHNPTGLLFFLGQHFVSLYLVKGGKPLDARRRWLAQRFKSQAANYTQQQLAEMIAATADTDSALRHGAANQRLTIESLALRLIDINREREAG